MFRSSLVVLLLLFSFSLQAQDKELSESRPLEEYSEDDFEVLKADRLKRIRKELVSTRAQINKFKEQAKADLDMLSKIQIESKIQKLETEYQKKKNLFIETITNINLSTDLEKRKKTSFVEDIKQILDPALNTFKKISEKPRKMQELKDEFDLLQGQFDRSKLANEKLKQFEKENKDKVLKWKVKEAISFTEKQSKKLKVKLEDLQFKMLKMENSDESIVSTFSIIIFDFIKTKGKNLFLSLFIFIIFFWLFKTGQAKFIDLVLFRVSRAENKEVYAWVIRPTKVIYNVVTTLIAFFMAILTLYVLNDWVLVTFVLIVFAALIWSSKQYLPLFLEQSKIVLNLGSVREGERVIYNDLPWKIEALGYYCKLENPALSGGSLRVNTKELINAHSRRSDPMEPWFPTQEGDWVEVAGEYGKVVLQSPAQVIVETHGGEKCFYEAKTFLAQKPKNFSQGFAIEFEFGLDYNLQGTLLERELGYFKAGIEKILYQKHPEIQGGVLELDIDFKQAGASSLDLRFFMKLDGKYAAIKLMLERSLKAEMVKICNGHNLTIPFEQLTVHMNNGN